MDRSKWVAVVTGAIAIILSIAYLLIVQFLDLRGEMLPAPQDLSRLPGAESRLWLAPTLKSPGAFGTNV
ncbi:hypothetical protein [Thermocoleostomius sinensis]|uniref:Glucose-inhibited division protein A n=1 Tax=Thermocoleostomius sinensis A174 TaxID=2016057 RepID=A0A9E8Z921_9CYAN|nr:hypothetical protein [Thermocoleostomius sinensis]WAL58749.1 glucose-inhibited division protein A [Thermocoleostomius sinensis A174]